MNSDDVTVRESKGNFIVALRTKGCTEEKIREATQSFKGLSLDDKTLESVAGGTSILDVRTRSYSKNHKTDKLPY